MMDLGGGNGNERVVAASTFERAVVWVGLPVLGAAAGWLVGLAAGWLLDLERVPFRIVFRLLHSAQNWYGGPIIGALLGLTVAVIAHRELLTVTVDGRRVRLHRNDGTDIQVARSDVDAVFLDGKALVLLGPAGGELARESTDLGAKALSEAFTRYGFPWRVDGDPYRDEFRLWVEELPGLPAGAEALLRARARALGRGKERETATLRRELLRLGVVVRDEKRMQYWRVVATPPQIGP